MKRMNSFLGMLILCLASAGALAFTPVTGSQQSQTTECEKACTTTHHECISAPDADKAACKAALDACLLKCKEVKPEPSPTPMASPSPIPPSPMESPSPSPSPTPPGF